MKKLLKYDKLFVKGIMVDRPNRFTLHVRMGSSIQRVYLPNPGKLSTVLIPGRKILCELVKSRGRKTPFNAFAVLVGKIYVTVNSAFANQIFSSAVEKAAIDEFRGYTITSREKKLNGWRVDFVLRGPKGEEVYAEVKSCTHVESGVAKFPDLPTERGRQHLVRLSELVAKGAKCYIVFVIQRPDARRFEPFEQVDPDFARMLEKAVAEGVNAMAVSTCFKPPNLHLHRFLPIRFSATR